MSELRRYDQALSSINITSAISLALLLLGENPRWFRQPYDSYTAKLASDIHRNYFKAARMAVHCIHIHQHLTEQHCSVWLVSISYLWS